MASNPSLEHTQQPASACTLRCNPAAASIKHAEVIVYSVHAWLPIVVRRCSLIDAALQATSPMVHKADLSLMSASEPLRFRPMACAPHVSLMPTPLRKPKAMPTTMHQADAEHERRVSLSAIECYLLLHLTCLLMQLIPWCLSHRPPTSVRSPILASVLIPPITVYRAALAR